MWVKPANPVNQQFTLTLIFMSQHSRLPIDRLPYTAWPIFNHVPLIFKWQALVLYCCMHCSRVLRIHGMPKTALQTVYQAPPQTPLGRAHNAPPVPLAGGVLWPYKPHKSVLRASNFSPSGLVSRPFRLCHTTFNLQAMVMVMPLSHLRTDAADQSG